MGANRLFDRISGHRLRLNYRAARGVNGVVLIAWICVLVMLAGLAATGKASFWVLSKFDRFHKESAKLPVDDDVLSPGEYLRYYLIAGDHPPPIALVLDKLVTNPNWCDRDLRKKYDDFGIGAWQIKRERWLRDQYCILFKRVHDTLSAMALIKHSDLKETVFSIELPASFLISSDEKRVKEIQLPIEIQEWIVEERVRLQADRDRRSLIDTFFLLIVLGAFGSLIFLTKTYVDKDEEVRLAAYIFRPVLGMFLALAVFIVDVTAHSVISTASVLQVRHETLYVLALASGLLSEHAYEAISLRAEAAISRMREQAGNNQGGSQNAQNETQTPMT